jgi:predicted N-acetyltransferase YhbS
MLQQIERVALRRGLESDVSAAEALFVAAFRARSGPYTTSQVEAAIGAGIGRARDDYAAARALVAELGGRLVAAGAWSCSQTPFCESAPAELRRGERAGDPSGQVTLRAICVAAEAGGRGIGEQLVEGLISDALRIHARSAALISTLGAVRFYERCGFSAVEEIGMRFGVTLLPAVLMRRALRISNGGSDE